ncbi:hypothetical protein DV738_g918, partial [Chaetothyriales sp. CBS 135597]
MGSPSCYYTLDSGVPLARNDTVDQLSTGSGGGYVLLTSTQLLENLAHFSRERIPERVVHAKAAAAKGYYEVTDDVSDITDADFLNGLGKKTEVLMRIPTTGPERGSADTVRDFRGFAVKFKTSEGNQDWVFNNQPVFFVRDPVKFPSLNRSHKRHPATNSVSADMFWDFHVNNQESIHALMFLFGDRGIPASVRTLNGYSGNTYKFTKDNGKRYVYVRVHFKSNQGIHYLTNAEGARYAGTEPDKHILDLQDAIKMGDYPSWDIYVQVIKPGDIAKAPIDIFDMTKTWPKKLYPLRKLGRVTLNKNPDNWFADVEQAAFSPSNMVPGIAPSPDPMLQARMFAYPDAQRYRLGVNYQYLPTNAPKSQVYCPIERDGRMNFTSNSGGDPNYIGSQLKPVRFLERLDKNQPPVELSKGHANDITALDQTMVSEPSPVCTLVTDKDFEQPRALWQIMASQEGAHDRFIDNLAANVSGVTVTWLRERVYGICEKLCEIFFATVFPLIPILHVRSFSEDFQQLWKSIDPVNPHNSETSIFLRRKPGFLCLLSSILFAALASSSPKRRIGALGENAQLVDTGDMYFLTTVSATLNGFPRQPSVYSLAAFIFSQSQFVREEEFSDAPEFISTAFRIALGMGLHRKVAHPGLSMAEIETRRRIWWYILHLDVMSSTSSGLSPLFVDEKMTNADFISQYDPPEWNSVNLQPEIDTRYLVASQRYEVTTKTRKILCCHFEDYFDTLTAVAEVEQDLHKVVRSTNALTDELILSANRAAEQQPSVASGSSADYLNLAATMARPFDRVWTLRPDPNDTEVVGFSAWSALLLHLMVHKAYCALYVPLFKNPAMASYEIIRSSAVKHAQAFVQLFIRVCNDSISEPYHWMYPGTYQPLQSVSLLLADLLQHPHSDHAELSHSLVDSIFELYKVDEGFVSQDDPPNRFLSTSSRDAWTLLLHTRRRALEQLGIDHHVLTPSNNEQVQEQVHNEIEIPPHFAQLTPGDGLAVANSFDWHEWDNMLGGSLGIIA